MGLIAYGKVDEHLYQKMKNLPLEYVSNFCNITFKENNKDWQNILATVDKVCFDFVKEVFLKINKEEEVFYSGGVALNVQWNTLLHKMGYKLNIDPAPYDGGLSIGCVRWAHHFLGIKQPEFKNFPYIQEPYANN
jgi:predicted NodU family carbamoyl transferase